MTEIELQQGQVTLSAPASLVEWANAAKAANQLAAPLCKTDFVPAHFRGNETAATAAILFGAEAGLSPLQALQGIYVISGKPAMYARTLMAVVMSHGHEVWTEELTDSKAIVCGQRRGSSHHERVVWTMDRARKAGYTKNAKYSTDPQAMLLARAQADICRRLAPDAILGMAYSVEEIEDEQPGPTTTVSRAATKRTVARKAIEAAEPDEPPLDEPAPPVTEMVTEPELDPAVASEPEPPLDAEPDTSSAVTRLQMGKMHACFSDLDVTDRAERLKLSSGVIGRPIVSANELTKTEASELIDVLDDCVQQGDVLALYAAAGLVTGHASAAAREVNP